jgi:hypothetical protein
MKSRRLWRRQKQKMVYHCASQLAWWNACTYSCQGPHNFVPFQPAQTRMCPQILMKLRNVKFHKNSFQLDCVCTFNLFFFFWGGDWTFQITAQIDQLAELGSECPLIESESICGISAGIAKKIIRDRTETIKMLEIPNRTQTGKETHTRILCQKNQGT